jgi:plasmid stability protein
VPVNLSIKNVPDHLAKRLRQRAARSHRSIQGELLAILDEALAAEDRLDARQVLAHVRGLGLKTGAEARAIIRADRDAR